MQRFLKRVKIVFWTLMIACPLIILGTIAAIKHNKIPAWEEIIEIDNIARGDVAPGFAAINKSRLSAVLVRSTSLGFWGTTTSSMTGTYFIAKGKHYVITVHHGIHGPCWLITVSHNNQEYECKEYIIKSEENDYLIMEVAEPLASRTPIRIPQDLPHGAQWKPSYSLLNKIIYTGYPNARGPLTLRGDVIGYGDEYLYIFSHAYGGSSGSGVFTKEGKYIGYIVAIDVGTTDLGVDILENVVIVAPAFNIDWSVVLN
jgi:hypothetical protein